MCVAKEEETNEDVLDPTHFPRCSLYYDVGRIVDGCRVDITIANECNGRVGSGRRYIAGSFGKVWRGQ